MPVNPAMLLLAALGLAMGGAAQAQETVPVPPLPGAPPPAGSDLAAGIAGTWELAVDNRPEACRLILRAQKSDKGDYFLGVPPACRHAIPSLAKVGRWGLPDATHLTLDEPLGTAVLTLTAAGDGFVGTLGARAFTLTRIGPPASTATAPAEATPLDGPAGAAIVPVARHPATPEPAATPAARVATDKPADVAGRYAIMREKRDTGCMLTLDDKTRGKAGGDRAQLAPGCRDQGIVIFDPVGWRLSKGELVLTARAGHSTKLDKVEEGRWAKDTKDGSKPLGLKRL